ncbi:MAG TPA: metalloregulator ArsR/SmtB family transcription factor [Candidatus Dormibacteraeota bacterium]
MPIAIDDSPPKTALTVLPSAVTDLFWLLFWTRKGEDHKLPETVARALTPVPELADRVRRFWGDDYPIYSELVILAHASGHLFDTDPEAFFSALAKAMPALGELELRSETPADRKLILTRLERLGADKHFRARYVQLLRDVWAQVAQLWTREGLPAVQADAGKLSDRAARGADLAELAPRLATLGDENAELARHALARGELALVPGYFGGACLMLDLPGLFLVGTQFDGQGRAESRRLEMEAMASELRVLADPTRLDILEQLAGCPLSVTDLMPMLNLAQPTISAHLRLLREAGLVRPVRSGARTNYVLDTGRLDEILRRPAKLIAKGG